jgi:hypothetical protein
LVLVPVQAQLGKTGKFEQIENFLPIFQQMISTTRKEIIKDKTQVFIKLIPVQGVFVVVKQQESLQA